MQGIVMAREEIPSRMDGGTPLFKNEAGAPGRGIVPQAKSAGRDARPSKLDCQSLLVFTRLLRCQTASLPDAVQVKSVGSKLGDLPSAPRGQRHVEDMCSE